MLANVIDAARRELSRFREDRWLQTLTLALPVALAALFIAIFWTGAPEKLPVAVVDLDQSQFSRKIVRQLDASPVLNVTDHYSSPAAGKNALVDGSHYALVVIPANIGRHVLLGQSPEVTVFFNAQYLLVAKSLRSALIETMATIAAETDVAEIMIGTPNITAAVATALPVHSEIGRLYNRNLNYSQFLIPGIMFALLQVLVCSVSIVVVAREFKWGGTAYWKEYGAVAGLVGKLLPYTILFTSQLLFLMWLFFGVLGWPHHASLIAIVPLLLLFVIACQAIGVFFYALTASAERGLSFAGAYSAPAFAFLGLTFPASDMSVFAQIWRDLMPAAHLADAYLARTSYGGDMSVFAVPAAVFCATLLLFPWIVDRLEQQVKVANG